MHMVNTKQNMCRTFVDLFIWLIQNNMCSTFVDLCMVNTKHKYVKRL